MYQAAQATARTKEEKEIAKEVRKVKEAEAKADLHADKARHAAQKLESKQAGHHYHIPGTGIVTGTGQHVSSGTATGHHPIPGIGTGTGTGMEHHHIPGMRHHHVPGAPGSTTTTSTTHNYETGYPAPHYNKHL